MDLLTHALAGVATAKLVAGEKATGKILAIGAGIALLPDIDFLITQFMSDEYELLYHRGFTHSLAFIFLFSSSMAWLISSKLHSNLSGQKWFLLLFLALGSHLFLDSLTNWGTHVFWPLDVPVAFSLIFVIDPLFTIPLLLGVLGVFLFKNQVIKRYVLIAGVFFSLLYLGFATISKQIAVKAFETSFQNQGKEILRSNIRPTMMNTVLWSVTAESEENYYTGFYSILDQKEKIDFFTFPKNHHLLDDVLHFQKVRDLVEVTNGYYMVEKKDHGYWINDLRFGQATGWLSGEGEFVFAYKIEIEKEEVSITRIRHSVDDGRKMLSQIWNRLKGI